MRNVFKEMLEKHGIKQLPKGCDVERVTEICERELVGITSKLFADMGGMLGKATLGVEPKEEGLAVLVSSGKATAWKSILETIMAIDEDIPLGYVEKVFLSMIEETHRAIGVFRADKAANEYKKEQAEAQRRENDKHDCCKIKINLIGDDQSACDTDENFRPE